MKAIARTVIGVLALLSLVIVAGLAYRSFRQHGNAALIMLAGPNTIEEAAYVPIGGIPQWIQIRGQDRDNPVLLFLHGGPGDAQSPLTVLYHPLEHDFTVVQWDQRGAGKTFGRGGRLSSAIPMQRMVDDALEVAQYVRQELHVSRVILVGHSWGSVLGVHAIKQRPDLFYAYVGTGQITSWQDMMSEIFAETLASAREQHDEPAVQTLETIGVPPFHSTQDYHTVRALRNRYLALSDREFFGLSRRSEPGLAFTSPELSLSDWWGWAQGLQEATQQPVYAALANADLPSLGYDFDVPFFIIQGRHDRLTPTRLAEAYFRSVQAPHKELILIDGGHFAAMTDMGAFASVLASRVRPFALVPSGARTGSRVAAPAVIASAAHLPGIMSP